MGKKLSHKIQNNAGMWVANTFPVWVANQSVQKTLFTGLKYATNDYHKRQLKAINNNTIIW